jgi:hypothetical protein
MVAASAAAENTVGEKKTIHPPEPEVMSRFNNDSERASCGHREAARAEVE